MPHQIFYNLDLVDWIYETVEKHRRGASWQSAWVEIYRKIGDMSKSSEEKSCPREAAKTLYEFGRLKDGGMPFGDCQVPELWTRSRNGTYAILATRLLRANPQLSKTSLWREIQQAVRREVRLPNAPESRPATRLRNSCSPDRA